MGELSVPLRELEDSYIEDLTALEDWFLQYEYLVRIGSEAPRLNQEARSDENKVPGCQTTVWLLLENCAGTVRISADSSSLLMRGLLSILTDLLDGRSSQEVADYTPRYIENTGLKAQISSDRFRGFPAVIDKIRTFARQTMDE